MRLRNNIFAAALDEMKRRGIVKNQKELAQKMGVSEDTITRILKDRTEVTEDAISKLQTASGCIFNLQWLRGESNEMFVDTHQSTLFRKNTNESMQVHTNPHESKHVGPEFYHDVLKLNATVIESMRKDIEYYQQMILDQDSLIQEHNEMIVALKSENSKLATQLEHTKTTLDAVRKNFDVQAEKMAKREQMIESLKIALDRASERYHHPMGVAEESPRYNHFTPDSEK